MSVLIMQASLLARSGKRPIDPDAQAIIDRMIPEPDTALKERLNAFVVALKNPALWGVKGAAWGRISTLGVSATAQNLHDSLLDWKRPVSYSVVGSITWNAADGWVGTNNSNNYIDTHWSPSGDANFALTDAGLFAYLTSEYDATGATIAGTSDASSAGYTRLNVTASTIQATVNTINNAQLNTPPADGLVFGTREAEQTIVFLDGTVGSVIRTSTATARATRSMKLFVLDNDGSRTQPFAGTAGMFGAGTSFTAAEQITLKSLYEAYVSA